MTTETTELQGVKDFWEGGSIADIKEVRMLIPISRDVKFRVDSVKVYDIKDGEQRKWKSIGVKLMIEDGIEVGEKVMYKGMSLTQNIPYFANPDTYDYEKSFFGKGQFLLALRQLLTATDIEADLIKGGISDEAMLTVAAELSNKIVLGNIVQTKVTRKNFETGKYEPVEPLELQNEVKAFKSSPDGDDGWTDT